MGEKKSSEKQIVEVKSKEKSSEKKKLKCIDKNFVIGQIFFWLFAIILNIYFKEAVYKVEGILEVILQLVIFVMALITDIILILFKKKNFQMHTKFFILAAVFGLFYFIATPFGNGTDEVSHFLRVFEISQKYTTLNYEETSEFPPAFSKLVDYKNNREMKYENYIKEFEAFSMNSAERKDLIGEYWNIRLYSPIQYLPQVIGVTAGRLISDNIVIIGMCGRITGFIFWLAVCTYAIKLMPNKKLFMTILCLLPVSLFSAICISGDTVTNAVCTIFIALIYRKIYLKEKVNLKEKIILILSACMIALCKIVYLPFVFLIILLKFENFENKKEYKKFVILLIGVSVIVGLSWFVIGSTNLANSNSKSKDQISFILQNPYDYCVVILKTLIEGGEKYIYQFMTGNELMCHAKTTIHPLFSYIISIALIFSLFVNEDERKIEVNLLRRILIYLMMFGTSLLIITAIYIQWTSLFQIGKDQVLGLQGRYYIPVFALLIYIVNKTKIETNSKTLLNTVILMQLPVICQIINIFV